MAEGLQMVTSSDGIATVRMNNGENRFRLSFGTGWMKILDEIERNTAIKGLIIIGNDKYFSLGLDIAYFNTQTPEYVEQTRNINGALYRRLTLLPIPTVAVINGHAFGAGAFLALSCDYRVMRSDRGWLCWPEVNLGMHIGSYGMHLLRMKVPCGKSLRDAVLFGKKLTSSEALSLQIVDEVADMDQLEASAIRLIKEVHGKNGLQRQALGQVKLDVYAERSNKEDNHETAKL